MQRKEVFWDGADEYLQDVGYTGPTFTDISFFVPKDNISRGKRNSINAWLRKKNEESKRLQENEIEDV